MFAKTSVDGVRSTFKYTAPPFVAVHDVKLVVPLTVRESVEVRVACNADPFPVRDKRENAQLVIVSVVLPPSESVFILTTGDVKETEVEEEDEATVKPVSVSVPPVA